MQRESVEITQAEEDELAMMQALAAMTASAEKKT